MVTVHARLFPRSAFHGPHIHALFWRQVTSRSFGVKVMAIVKPLGASRFAILFVFYTLPAQENICASCPFVTWQGAKTFCAASTESAHVTSCCRTPCFPGAWFSGTRTHAMKHFGALAQKKYGPHQSFPPGAWQFLEVPHTLFSLLRFLLLVAGTHGCNCFENSYGWAATKIPVLCWTKFTGGSPLGMTELKEISRFARSGTLWGKAIHEAILA